MLAGPSDPQCFDVRTRTLGVAGACRSRDEYRDFEFQDEPTSEEPLVPDSVTSSNLRGDFAEIEVSFFVSLANQMNTDPKEIRCLTRSLEHSWHRPFELASRRASQISIFDSWTTKEKAFEKHEVSSIIFLAFAPWIR